MSRFRSVEVVHPSPFYVRETSIFAPKSLLFPSFVEEEHDLSLALDILNPVPISNPFELFDSVTDLIYVEKTPSICSYKRIRQRATPDFPLQTLCDRVSALEAKFDRIVNPRNSSRDRKYTWTAEIKGPVDRKYQWIREVKEGKKEEKATVVKKGAAARNYKWTAEIKGGREEGGITRSYKFKTSNGDTDSDESSVIKSEKKHKKKDKKKENKLRAIEIEEVTEDDHGVLALRQAFGRRAGVIKKNKGKNKELSAEDAALMIQMTFRAYLIRRSKALRALRELAVAKTKLKDLRALFNNISYRHQIARNAEERQRLSEKIIVLLLTVDAIEGCDLMVRSAKRSMVDELEAMLDTVDPQTQVNSLSMRRRRFDMPDGAFSEQIADGVAHVVQMLENQDE